MRKRNLLLVTLIGVLAVLDERAHAEISSSSDLNCDFTSTCRWRNSSDVSGHFETASLLEADAQNRIMPMDEHNPKPFAFTAGLMGRMMALLVSEVVTCQLGGASIKYWYYKTGLDSQLEVCIRQPPGNRDLSQMRCYDGVSSTFGKQWIFRAVELPPIAQPFEIVFKTIYSPPASIIALDDIVFEATLCESSNSGSSEGAGGTFDETPPTLTAQLADFDGNDVRIDDRFDQRIGTLPTTSRAVNYGAPTSHRHEESSRSGGSELGGPRTGPMFASLCTAVDCDFDENTLCSYLTSSTNSSHSDDGSTLSKWQLSNQSVLNSLTGIPTDLRKGGYFLFAGGTTVTPAETFILSSGRPFRVSEPARVDFFVYQAGVRGRLRVCVDDDEDCPVILEGKDIDANAQRWKNHYFDIAPGEHVLHFVVEDLHNNYVIGLDNIQLLNRFGTSSLAC